MQNLEFNSGVIKPFECVSEAWGLIKKDYWLLFGISLVGGLLAGATMYVLFGAMICGIFGVYLKRIDGGEVKFEDLWLGMKYIVPSIPVVILFVVPLVIYFVVVFITLYSPLIAAAIMGEHGDPTIIIGTFAVAIVIDIIVAILMTIVHSFIIFAFPLMVDRNLGGMDAIKLSARAVMKNMGGIGGMIVVNFGIVLLGQMAFCIGIYFVIPIITASNLVAYRKVFPRLETPMIVPPALFGER
ncbi:MAG: hypothetical protein ACRD6X_14925 [Pyrinomonadaceae bacterium]